MTNGATGEVTWDVTTDVQQGYGSWLVKKTQGNGNARFYAKEHPEVAGDPDLAPRLLLAFDTLPSAQITGLGAAPDIAQGALDSDPTELLYALLSLMTDTLTSTPGGPLSSTSDPIVAYAPGGLTLTGGFSGTGVLIVDGAYAQQDSVAWTGLVVVRADAAGPPSFAMWEGVGPHEETHNDDTIDFLFFQLYDGLLGRSRIYYSKGSWQGKL